LKTKKTPTDGEGKKANNTSKRAKSPTVDKYIY
jgi:hypothetical protein